MVSGPSDASRWRWLLGLIGPVLLSIFAWVVVHWSISPTVCLLIGAVIGFWDPWDVKGRSRRGDDARRSYVTSSPECFSVYSDNDWSSRVAKFPFGRGQEAFALADKLSFRSMGWLERKLRLLAGSGWNGQHPTGYGWARAALSVGERLWWK